MKISKPTSSAAHPSTTNPRIDVVRALRHCRPSTYLKGNRVQVMKRTTSAANRPTTNDTRWCHLKATGPTPRKLNSSEGPQLSEWDGNEGGASRSRCGAREAPLRQHQRI
eukprot:2989585-Rhodomonas_salina.1